MPVIEGEHNWHYEYDGLSRVTYACSDWTGTACASTGHEFHYAYDGAGNLLRFDKWNASTSQVDTVRYVINGANQITPIHHDVTRCPPYSQCQSNFDHAEYVLSYSHAGAWERRL